MVADSTDGQDLDSLPRKRLSGKRIVLFIVLPLIILAGGGAAIYFSGLLDGLFGPDKAAEEAAAAAAPPPGCVATFHDLPEVLVNLASAAPRRQSYMKLKVSLELCRPEDRPKVVELQTRVIDNLQVYLRELRIEDLRGSAGFQRLREELRYRISVALQPVQVRDVLFTEVLVQ
jgi:flagellar protein FliL